MIPNFEVTSCSVGGDSDLVTQLVTLLRSLTLCQNNMQYKVITTCSCNAEVSNRLICCYTLMIDHHIYSD